MISMPFEQGAPPTPGRSRKTYVTLDRAIRFGTSVCYKGCEKIGKGVKYSEACHEKFRVLLEKESRKAIEDAEAKKLSTEAQERLEAQAEAGLFELEEGAREIDAEATEAVVPDLPAGTVQPIPKHPKRFLRNRPMISGNLTREKGHGAKSISNLGNVCLLQSAMTVHLVQMMFHQKG
jgi:hypothetical protein